MYLFIQASYFKNIFVSEEEKAITLNDFRK